MDYDLVQPVNWDDLFFPRHTTKATKNTTLIHFVAGLEKCCSLVIPMQPDKSSRSFAK